MLVKCDECNGTGKAYYSCCSGEVITGDIPMCPECMEHLGEEECELCGGKGEIEEENNQTTPKVDLIMRAEFANDLKQDR